MEEDLGKKFCSFADEDNFRVWNMHIYLPEVPCIGEDEIN